MAKEDDAINTGVLSLATLGTFKSGEDVSDLVKEEGLKTWLLGFGEKVNTASVCYRNFRSFYNWLQDPEKNLKPELRRKTPLEFPELRGKTPLELAKLQYDLNRSEGFGSDAKSRKICEALIIYLESSKDWRMGYKTKIYSSVKSFFDAHDNKIPFPKLKSGMKTRLKGEPRKTGKELRYEELKLIIDGSNPCYKALFACMLASGMGLGEALEWSDGDERMSGMDRLTEALAKPVSYDPRVIEIHLGARKRNVDEDFYVYIGGSALTYLEAWLKHRKIMEARPNAPKPFPKSIFVGNTYNPLTANAAEFYWLAQLRDLGLYEKRKTRTNRTNRNIHQIRSVYRTRASRAVSSGSEAESKIIEYFMGHKPDAMNYNQIHGDRPLRVKTYLKALQYLDTQQTDPGKIEEQIAGLSRENEKLTREITRLTEKLDGMIENTEDVRHAQSVPGMPPEILKAMVWDILREAGALSPEEVEAAKKRFKDRLKASPES